MVTSSSTFILAFALALLLTPAARWLGNRFGAIDEPTARNVHIKPIARSGGLAILLSFVLALLASSLSPTAGPSYPRFIHSQMSFALLGGLVIFCVGFFDDFHRLRPGIKFLGQILAASLAYYGGLQIHVIAFGATAIHLGILSYFITVFWFLLLINALNLIDGLDGLAVGVAFF
ncbi:MAG: undecaprenyl/decaprenyl-phosphate alpha-N-acetylglucosaminyl 1-phosphate transferase, partial [Bacteroidia bacterium]|nr:undecaprenyl/decaprenyl-phosphate alpha-N-acetylglucosaminyl 1-phosphate transferase [Bacteroidia bacterium]